LFFRCFPYTSQDDYPDGGVPDGGVPDGGDPDGGVPDGGVPDGRVPFICIPPGGVPEGWVPFICIPSGGVPIGPADSLNWGLSPVPASPVSPDNAVCAAVAKDGIGDSVLLVSTDELLSVQPATRIPATRAADATSTMILFFFIGFVS
jgi:hypothetical protein